MIISEFLELWFEITFLLVSTLPCRWCRQESLLRPRLSGRGSSLPACPVQLHTLRFYQLHSAVQTPRYGSWPTEQSAKLSVFPIPRDFSLLKCYSKGHSSSFCPTSDTSHNLFNDLHFLDRRSFGFSAFSTLCSTKFPKGRYQRYNSLELGGDR